MPRPDAVLLVAFGGPTRMEEVRPFLANVLKGVPVPPARVEQVIEQYRAIGGKSPLNELTVRQADALRAALIERGMILPVYVGMKNWPPYVADTLKEILASGARRVFAIVMSNHRSEASWDKYAIAVQEAQRTMNASPIQVGFASSWHTHPKFIESVASRVREAADPSDIRGWHLLFTAHSIPTAMAEASGYHHQVEESARLVARSLSSDFWSVAYQSRSGRPSDPWLEPDVSAALESLAAAGKRDVCVVPIGFVCDHVEVLYDLDVKARQTANRVGIRMVRAGTVSDHPSFIDMLADLVVEGGTATPA